MTTARKFYVYAVLTVFALTALALLLVNRQEQVSVTAGCGEASFVSEECQVELDRVGAAVIGTAST